jgi:predicted ATPase/DNA-binding CsgD family transcriptional regulator
VATTDSDHGEQTGPVAAVGAAKASEVTAREAEVLTLLTRHLTNVEIADALSISVRTVESHVSALLRKLHYRDRRSLARHADQPAGAPERSALHSWPSAVTPLIGRSAERAALASAIAEHRMVTVTGPGGVGKTRLTLSVAAEIARERRDGAWFVDLVKVTDPATVVAAIADTIGVPEQRSISIESALVASLGERDGLLVIDNCEHLLDGVRHCVERILGSCPNVTVLATSRSRLLVPYEWVYEVPGLSVSEDGGDAVDLFTARVAATGEPALPDPRRVAALCRALDGMALAIELAAARYSTLGLDGLEGALDERLRFLIGGTRIADRHRSLRDAIDWSYELLEPEDRVLLNDVSVLASWFDVEAARAVSRPNAERATVADGLARLATDSLLVVQRGEPTRYRALETIRQYGIEQLAAAGELGAIRARHEQWCRAEMTTLRSAAPDDAWCARFDRVVDDIRAALLWSAADERRRSESASLAADLAALLFVRGRPAETQRRYEQAAELTPIDALRATYLRLAAGAAASRYVGNEALRLLGAAADLATTLGDGAAAAHDLAWMAIYIIRAPGIMVDKPTVDEAAERCDSARAMSDGSLRAEAAIATAAACCGRSDPAVLDWSRTAVDLAHRSADPITESAALDQLCAVQLERDDIPETVGLIRERGQVIERLDVDASSGFEYLDFYLMASEVNIAAGDLAASRRYASPAALLPRPGALGVRAAAQGRRSSRQLRRRRQQRRALPRQLGGDRAAGGLGPRRSLVRGGDGARHPRRRRRTRRMAADDRRARQRPRTARRVRNRLGADVRRTGRAPSRRRRDGGRPPQRRHRRPAAPLLAHDALAAVVRRTLGRSGGARSAPRRPRTNRARPPRGAGQPDRQRHRRSRRSATRR